MEVASKQVGKHVPKVTNTHVALEWKSGSFSSNFLFLIISNRIKQLLNLRSFFLKIYYHMVE